MRLLPFLWLCLLAISAPASAQTEDNPTVDPAEAPLGKVCQWESEDGIRFEYYVPASYEPEQGANMTLVLHGNGLDHRWTFWNHPAGSFRSADIVVSPDGTTWHEGTRANEFLGKTQDAKRFHEFLEEVRAHWNVRQTFLYGHSQGSFFTFYYAGQYPEDVDGVCGHASGVWNWTQRGSFGHHQAIGVMHGTEDHIPYAQGWHGALWYRERKYPLVHLNTLYDWNHRPHHAQAGLVLAWCEGMTSDRPERVSASLETLNQSGIPLGRDWSALYAVADRLATLAGASEAQHEQGRDVAAAVDALARRHVVAIEESIDERALKDLGRARQVGHLIRFLYDFEGVPAHTEFMKEYGKAISKNRDAGERAQREFFEESAKSPRGAFAAGLELLEEGFLDYRAPRVLEQLRVWSRDPKTHRLSKRQLSDLEASSAAFDEGLSAGLRAYDELNAAF